MEISSIHRVDRESSTDRMFLLIGRSNRELETPGESNDSEVNTERFVEARVLCRKVVKIGEAMVGN